jgi:hypothetical protein
MYMYAIYQNFYREVPFRMLFPLSPPRGQSMAKGHPSWQPTYSGSLRQMHLVASFEKFVDLSLI